MACSSGCCGPTQNGETINQTQATSNSLNVPARKLAEYESSEDAEAPGPDAKIVSNVTLKVTTSDECHTLVPVESVTGDSIRSERDNCEQGCCTPNIKEPQPNPQDSDCGKGCCNPDPPAVPIQTQVRGNCGDGCCSTPEAGPKEPQPNLQDSDCGKGCCNPDPPAVPIQTQAKGNCGDGCCSSPVAGPKEPIQKEESCAIDPKPSNNTCKDACCSGKGPAKEEEISTPDCCVGKVAPCCSTSCIDRIALRECQAGDDSESCCDSFQSNIGLGEGSEKACRTHVRRAYDRYQAQLEAIGCICRAMIALGKESCCTQQNRSGRTKARSRLPTGSPSDSRVSLVSTSSKRSACRKPCCLPKLKPAGESSRPKAPRCRPASVRTPPASCTDGCCDNEKASNSPPNIQDDLEIDRNDIDPEKRGMSGQEHVVLAISGMTCTGCETKLQRTMSTLPAISNLKTSLVLARAEFDIDLSMFSASEVMKHLERTTEFKCEKLTSHGSSLDLICDGDPTDIVGQKWPDGVTEVRAIDRKIVRVDFDPKIIGARDLIENGWNTPMQLAPAQPDQTLHSGAKHVRQVGLSTLLSICLTIPVLVMAWAPLPEHEIAYGSASLALATIVQVLIAGPFYPKALKAMIFSRVIEMDLLIVLSTSAAYIFSVISFGYLASGQPLSTGEFFETSTLLVSLIMVGRYLAALARQKAVESISIRSLQTSSATICLNDSTQQIDSRLLQFGDIFMIPPDSAVPTDGTVLSGNSEVDESMMTGESTPVEKRVGSTVIAGSVNGPGTLKVRLTRLPDDNTISAIAGMVDEAKLSKPKLQEIADRVAKYFVPVVVALTITTFAIWVAIGVAVENKSGSNAVIQAVTYAITVLIVSCPCAIGLAVPMVVVIATGIAAERGVIFKSSESIELASKTSHVVFDKTGTLTQGKLVVVREEYLNESPGLVQSLLLALVEHVKHPVSVAVANHLKAAGVMAASSVSDTKVRAGKGVEGTYLDSTIFAGNSRWLELSSNTHVQEIQSHAQTAFCFVIDDAPAAIFGLQDTLRPDAAVTVSKLQDSGIVVHMLSGDDDRAVQEVGLMLGIPDTNIRSRCGPADKQAYIKDLLETTPSTQQPKSKPPVVMFCGDGTNDAAALAQATIGIHINEGTDVAKSAADVVLMRPSLSGIQVVIGVSKKAIHRIWFNFGWSFVYNLFAILLSSGAFVNARIPPAYAGLGELVSVLPVIGAALLLRWAKI